MLTNIYSNDDGKRILVYYADSNGSSQLGLDKVREAVQKMTEYRVLNIIIITPIPLTPESLKHLNSLVSYNIDIFLEQEMSFDPTEHFLVPKHIPLTDEEASIFLAKNSRFCLGSKSMKQLKLTKIACVLSTILLPITSMATTMSQAQIQKEIQVLLK